MFYLDIPKKTCITILSKVGGGSEVSSFFFFKRRRKMCIKNKNYRNVRLINVRKK